MGWIKRLFSRKKSIKQYDTHNDTGEASAEFHLTLTYDMLLLSKNLSKEEKREYLIKSEEFYKKLNDRDGIR